MQHREFLPYQTSPQQDPLPSPIGGNFTPQNLSLDSNETTGHLSLNYTSQGDEILRSPLTGYMYVDVAQRTVTFHITALIYNVDGGSPPENPFGFTSYAPPLPLTKYYERYFYNPQIMPLPGRIRFSFSGVDETAFKDALRTNIKQYLSDFAYLPPENRVVSQDMDDLLNDKPLFLRRDPQAVGSEFELSPVSTTNVDTFVDELVLEESRRGILFDNSATGFIRLPTGASVEIEFFDYRNYGVFNNPKAIFEPDTDLTVNGLSASDEVYIVPSQYWSNLDGDFGGDAADRAIFGGDNFGGANLNISESGGLYLLENTAPSSDFSTNLSDYQELNIRIERSGGGFETEAFVPVKKYHKFSLFVASPIWHFRNWATAGLLKPEVIRDDPFYRELFLSGRFAPENRLYPENHTTQLADYLESTDYNPSAPIVAGYIEDTPGDGAPSNERTYEDGESYGLQRPVLSAFAAQRAFEWTVNRVVLEAPPPEYDPNDPEENGDPYFQSTNTNPAAPLLNRENPHYRGSYGIEEYVKRVAMHEIGIDQEWPLHDAMSGGDFEWPQHVRHVRDGLMAQMVAARSYLLHALAHDARGIENPARDQYAPVVVDSSEGFQVHGLANLFERVQQDDVAGTSVDQVRQVIEEALALSWGQVGLWQSEVADMEYFGAQALMQRAGFTATTYNQSVDRFSYTCQTSNDDFEQPVRTRRGVECQHTNHGRGLSQGGAKDLSVRGLTWLQILEWYFFGLSVRNCFGGGDLITLPEPLPSSGSYQRSVQGHPDTQMPLDTVHAPVESSRRIWQSPSMAAITSGSAENQLIAVDFEAFEFCNKVNPDDTIEDTVLWVDTELVQRLQALRFLSGPITILGMEVDAATSSVLSTHARIETNATDDALGDTFGHRYLRDPQSSQRVLVWVST